MGPAGIVFDLDDTLIESFPTYVRLHRAVARSLGWPVPTWRDLVAYHGTWRQTLARLFPGRPLEAFVERYDRWAHLRPYPALPGAAEALRSLARRGHPMWIVTNRSRKRLARRMAEAGLSPRTFAGIFCREDQPAPKPSGRCFDPVLRHPAARGRPLLYVGDRQDDARAARAAGLPFVGVRTGPEARLGTGPPRGVALLDSVAELPDFLARSGRSPAGPNLGQGACGR